MYSKADLVIRKALYIHAVLHSVQRAWHFTVYRELASLPKHSSYWQFRVSAVRVVSGLLLFLFWYGLVLRYDLIQYVAQAGLELRAIL